MYEASLNRFESFWAEMRKIWGDFQLIKNEEMPEI